MKRYFILLFVLLGCGSEYGVSVTFDDPSLAVQSVRFQVAIVSSCIAIQLGERPVAPLQIVEFSADESARGLGTLDPGDYGLYARAIDENCDVVAAGCQPITVEAGGEGTLRVVLSAAGGDLCGSSSACVNGRCTSGVDANVDAGPDSAEPDPDAGLTCLDGQLMCEGRCVPSDAANCGTCGNVCNFPGGAGECTAGECVLTCDTDFADCDTQIDNGCETSLQTASNCGACEMICSDSAPLCSSVSEEISCVADCGAATQCGSSCVDLQSNLLHCSGCDIVCDLPNALSACVAGECTIGSCDLGFDDCDAEASNGCEVDVRSDTANCGGCGMLCDTGHACRDGTCMGYIGVGVGPSHACGIQADRALWCWGRNDHGQSNLEQVGTSLEVPTQFFLRPGTPWSVRQVAIGARHTCGINLTGRIECGGDNSMGQRGNRSNTTEVISVISSDGTFSRRDFEQLAAGANHTCAIDSVNGVWCWGDAQYGQRATGSGSGANLIPFGSRVALSVTTSDNASCFRLDDARVQCVGRNDQGQLGRGALSDFETSPSLVLLNSGATLTGVQTLVAGAQSFCAIVTDGRLYCWGKNDDQEIDPTVDGPIMRATQVATSAAAAFLFDGTVCWRTTVGSGEVSCRGRRRDGQFAGTVNSTPSTLNTRLATLDTIRDVVASHSAACGFREGVLSCWGASYEGVIPRASLNIEEPTPLRETSSETAQGWTDITLSSTGGCGIDSGRRPHCWGDGQYGALGNGTQQTAALPRPMDGNGVRRVFRGEFGTGVLFQDDSIEWTGTERTRGLFGGTLLTPTTTELPRPTGFSAVFRHGCALTAPGSEGSVMCWGENDSGQTGHAGTNTGLVYTSGGPLLAVYIASVVRTGEDFTCSLTNRGAVRCWGDNRFGQLGNAAVGPSSMSPVDVSGVPSGMELLAVGRRHACASSPSLGMYCWGANEAGQTGSGRTGTSSTPVQIRIEMPTAISAGANFTCVVAQAQLHCWGGNERHQLADETTETRVDPVRVDLDHPTDIVSAPMGYGSCAEQENEWLCWGANDFSGLSVGAGSIFNAPTTIPF